MIAGAGELERRIAAHAHWRLAEAVQDGHQSARDPDADCLIALGDGVRRYRATGSHVHGEEDFEKRLVGGWWQATLLRGRVE